ncbi:MAG: CoA transferase [Chloroflexi bacterium]|nr:CoA transferase [Chloroflexota bacterium]
MPGPLAGLLALDLTRILAGPFCGMTLRDLGAEVIKIEHPLGGDPARGNGPFIGEYSSYFLSVNRGKKSVTLDLSKPEGKDLLIKLAKRADILIENFVPGTMAGFGVGYDALKKHNPRLIYCAISGFGQTGPYASKPALDIIVQAMGGIMSVTGEPGGRPLRPGTSIADVVGGMYGVIGILSALHERKKSGKGQLVDISMLDCQLAIQEGALSRYFVTGDVPKPIGSRHPIFTPFDSYQGSDGKWFVVAIIGGRVDQWPLFCSIIDRVDLIDKPEFGTGWLRTQNHAQLNPILLDTFKAKPSHEWLRAFAEVGIACGPVNTIDQVASDPQIAARKMIVAVRAKKSGRVKVVGNPIKLSRTPSEVRTASPGLGEHNSRVYGAMLKQSKKRLAELKKKGVL